VTLLTVDFKILQPAFVLSIWITFQPTSISYDVQFPSWLFETTRRQTDRRGT